MLICVNVITSRSLSLSPLALLSFHPFPLLPPSSCRLWLVALVGKQMQHLVVARSFLLAFPKASGKGMISLCVCACGYMCIHLLICSGCIWQMCGVCVYLNIRACLNGGMETCICLSVGMCLCRCWWVYVCDIWLLWRCRSNKFPFIWFLSE